MSTDSLTQEQHPEEQPTVLADELTSLLSAERAKNGLLKRSLEELSKQLDEVNALLSAANVKNAQLIDRNKKLVAEKVLLQNALKPFFRVTVD